MGDDEDGSPGFAQQAMDAVTSGRVKIHPDRYAKSYLDWLGEKRDWCISRQLWWGHRIPVWTCVTWDLEALEDQKQQLEADPTLSRLVIRAGPRCPRHLVQLGPLATFDARLARGDARADAVLSDGRPLDGPRH